MFGDNQEDYFDIDNLQGIWGAIQDINRFSGCRSKECLLREIEKFILQEIQSTREWNDYQKDNFKDYE
ncbi:hypothetical protein [Pleurocapsa sp. FMAR1]|uniref:hypothetical protein n=1 Tax=Pleurocapsa sp. FMAR1 TaxID=3040204 RepID=UPI0029C6094A|nr:hypothetical protein [Pleurocapsa sp. FMAR1]